MAKKWWIILIICIVAVIIIGYFLYSYYQMMNNPEYCITDLNCQVKYNSCSCSNYCYNGVGIITFAECIHTKEECDNMTNKSLFSSCSCKNNLCIPNK